MLKLFRKEIHYIWTDNFEEAVEFVKSRAVGLAIVDRSINVEDLAEKAGDEHFISFLFDAKQESRFVDFMVSSGWLGDVVNRISGGLGILYTEGCPGHRHVISRGYAMEILLKLANRNRMVAVK